MTGVNLLFDNRLVDEVIISQLGGNVQISLKPGGIVVFPKMAPNSQWRAQLKKDGKALGQIKLGNAPNQAYSVSAGSGGITLSPTALHPRLGEKVTLKNSAPHAVLMQGPAPFAPFILEPGERRTWPGLYVPGQLPMTRARPYLLYRWSPGGTTLIGKIHPSFFDRPEVEAEITATGIRSWPLGPEPVKGKPVEVYFDNRMADPVMIAQVRGKGLVPVVLLREGDISESMKTTSATAWLARRVKDQVDLARITLNDNPQQAYSIQTSGQMGVFAATARHPRLGDWIVLKNTTFFSMRLEGEPPFIPFTLAAGETRLWRGFYPSGSLPMATAKPYRLYRLETNTKTLVGDVHPSFFDRPRVEAEITLTGLRAWPVAAKVTDPRVDVIFFNRSENRAKVSFIYKSVAKTIWNLEPGDQKVSYRLAPGSVWQVKLDSGQDLGTVRLSHHSPQAYEISTSGIISVPPDLPPRRTAFRNLTSETITVESPFPPLTLRPNALHEFKRSFMGGKVRFKRKSDGRDMGSLSLRDRTEILVDIHHPGGSLFTYPNPRDLGPGMLVKASFSNKTGEKVLVENEWYSVGLQIEAGKEMAKAPLLPFLPVIVREERGRRVLGRVVLSDRLDQAYDIEARGVIPRTSREPAAPMVKVAIENTTSDEILLQCGQPHFSNELSLRVLPPGNRFTGELPRRLPLLFFNRNKGHRYGYFQLGDEPSQSLIIHPMTVTIDNRTGAEILLGVNGWEGAFHELQKLPKGTTTLFNHLLSHTRLRFRRPKEPADFASARLERVNHQLLLVGPNRVKITEPISYDFINETGLTNLAIYRLEDQQETQIAPLQTNFSGQGHRGETFVVRQQPGGIQVAGLTTDASAKQVFKVTRKAIPSRKPVRVEVHNGLPFRIKLLLVDENGKEIPQQVLEANQIAFVSGFAGHPLVFRGETYPALADVYLPGQADNQRHALRARSIETGTGAVRLMVENKASLAVSLNVIYPDGGEKPFKQIAANATYDGTFGQGFWVVLRRRDNGEALRYIGLIKQETYRILPNAVLPLVTLNILNNQRGLQASIFQDDPNRAGEIARAIPNRITTLKVRPGSRFFFRQKGDSVNQESYIATQQAVQNWHLNWGKVHPVEVILSNQSFWRIEVLRKEGIATPAFAGILTPKGNLIVRAKENQRLLFRRVGDQLQLDDYKVSKLTTQFYQVRAKEIAITFVNRTAHPVSVDGVVLASHLHPFKNVPNSAAIKRPTGNLLIIRGEPNQVEMERLTVTDAIDTYTIKSRSLPGKVAVDFKLGNKTIYALNVYSVDEKGRSHYLMALGSGKTQAVANAREGLVYRLMIAGKGYLYHELILADAPRVFLALSMHSVANDDWRQGSLTNKGPFPLKALMVDYAGQAKKMFDIPAGQEVAYHLPVTTFLRLHLTDGTEAATYVVPFLPNPDRAVIKWKHSLPYKGKPVQIMIYNRTGREINIARLEKRGPRNLVNLKDQTKTVSVMPHSVLIARTRVTPSTELARFVAGMEPNQVFQVGAGHWDPNQFDPGKNFPQKPDPRVVFPPGTPQAVASMPHRQDLEILQNAIQGGTLQLNAGLVAQLSAGARTAFDALGGNAGSIALMQIFFPITDVRVKIVEGKPGIVGEPGREITNSGELLPPNRTQIQITGKTQLLNKPFDVLITLSPLLGFAKPALTFFIKTPDKQTYKFNAGDLAARMGLGNQIKYLLDWLDLVNPNFAYSNFATVYFPAFDAGIAAGLNLFCNLRFSNRDSMLKTIFKTLNKLYIKIEDFACHLAAAGNGTYLVEAAVKRDFDLGTYKNVFLSKQDFNLKWTRTDLALLFDPKSATKTPKITLSNDLVVTIDKSGKKEALVFNGGFKFQGKSIDFFATFNPTGRGPSGELAAKHHVSEWKDPLGLKGVVVRQAAVQFGGSLYDFGIHCNALIGDLDVIFSFLLNPDEPAFVAVLISDYLTPFHIFNMIEPYRGLPRGARNALYKLSPIKYENVIVNIVLPKETSIGTVHFRDPGVTLQAKIRIFNWTGFASLYFDLRNGLLVQVDLQKIDWGHLLRLERDDKQKPLKLKKLVRTGIGKYAFQPHPPGGGPVMVMKLSTSSQDLQFYLSAAMVLLGLKLAVTIEEHDGKELRFRLTHQWKGFKLSLSGRFSPSLGFASRLTCSGSLKLRLDLKNLGPQSLGRGKVADKLSLVPIFDVEADLAITLSPRGIYCSVDRLMLTVRVGPGGYTLLVPALDLNHMPKNFGNRGNGFEHIAKLIKQNARLKENFVGLLNDPARWVELAKSGHLGYAGDAAQILAGPYGQGVNQISGHLNNLGIPTNEAFSQLQRANFTQNNTMMAMTQAGYKVEEVAGAAGISKEDLVKQLVGANHPAAEVAKATGIDVEDVINIANPFSSSSPIGGAVEAVDDAC